MIFRWVFIPWLQQELDNYKNRVNRSRKRRDRNKVLPHGIPELIHKSPGHYGALDFKVTIDQTAIDYVRQTYINPDHVVFDLVPPALCAHIKACYVEIGSPSVNRSSVWNVYNDLLRTLQDKDRSIRSVMLNINLIERVEDEECQLISGLRDLLENDEGYMGGVANGMGLQTEHHHRLDELDGDGDLLPTTSQVGDVPMEQVKITDMFSDDEDDDLGLS